MNIYDTANQLERELRELDQYKKVTECLANIEANEEAKALLDEFRQINVVLQQKQMSGQEITEEDIAHAQGLGQRASENELVKELMTAEQMLNMVVQEINQIITKPLQEMYAQK